MFIRAGKRFNIYATNIEIDGIKYPHFTDPAIREQLGITEIPEPQPPEGYIEEEYFRVEQDDAPYVVFTPRNEEMIAEIRSSKLERNVDALWTAANDYNYKRISGAAIGLLTMGVLQNKPEAVAVMSWIQSIWNLYYSRKALLTHEQIPEGFTDFSECGEMPYTVPELTAIILGT